MAMEPPMDVLPRRLQQGLHHLRAAAHHRQRQRGPGGAAAAPVPVVDRAASAHAAELTDQRHVAAPDAVHQGGPAVTQQPKMLATDGNWWENDGELMGNWWGNDGKWFKQWRKEG